MQAKTETVGQAVDLIHAKLQEDGSASAEETAWEVIAKTTAFPIENASGKSRLADLFPAADRKESWEKLQQRLGGTAVGGLRRPGWLGVIGWIFALGIGAGLTIPLGFGWAAAAAVFFGAFWISATDPWATIFPAGWETAGDLIELIEKRQAVFLENQGLDREAVRERVVAIVAEQLGVNPEACTDHARFVADLGCD